MSDGGEAGERSVWVVATDYAKGELLGIHATEEGAQEHLDQVGLDVPVDVAEWTVEP